MARFDFGGEIVWRPTPDYTEGSHLQRFMQREGLASWDELYQRSIEDIAWFNEAMLRYLDIRFEKPYRQIVDLSRGKPWARWCVDGEMNITASCLDKWITSPEVPIEGQELRRNVAALRYEGEDGQTRILTYGDLYREVNRVANGLRQLGLGKGDAIGLYMPMVPEIAIALLAIARIGAVILPLFSGYGPGAVAMRLADAGAKALFTADGFFRRGRLVNMKALADEAINDLPDIRHVIVYRRGGEEIPWNSSRDLWWEDLVAGQPRTAEAERTNAEDPLMIIYTSGTTGWPKGAVHVHCGFPVKAAIDLAMDIDLRPQDTLYWMTDMGWMMGPWEVFGTLLLGATMLFYDGAPDYPSVDRLWRLIDRHRVTTLGISPTLIRSLMQHGEEPVRRCDLSTLRILASTGEPWNVGPWRWFFDVVGRGRCPIINYTGGTEISGAIISGNVMLPLKPCAFSGPNVGMAADVVDEAGNSLRGQVGELVIREPWIGMTRGFWRDPKRYLETYWERFPDVWVHGDWAVVDEDGQWYILGRSDDTIKIGGKRLGPAEIETVVTGHPAVVEAGAIGVPDEIKGEALVIFCVLVAGQHGSDALAEELRGLVAETMGRPLAPKAVLFVPDLPKTRNAKIMRRVLRAAYLGEPAGDLSALVNPDVVAQIQAVRDQQP